MQRCFRSRAFFRRLAAHAPLCRLRTGHSGQTPAHQVRCELDATTDHIKAKIANAEQMKVHTMLVIGARDMEANAVSVRIHGQGTSAPNRAPRASVTFCSRSLSAGRSKIDTAVVPTLKPSRFEDQL
ncbi:MAG TPA: His/Gly/Thr/Pro-type tRNA ligase C-terminal domain-containing protein [Chthoniobacterales bacterium]|nr:His/Gly/Thr/Pro-type tRNA ligase C-terminal domain-containing protein [Chthoniobacterales bacterium]